MIIITSTFDGSTNWISGMIDDYKFSAKHFDEGSKYGINDGRTSKLTIYKNNFSDCIVNYDRGWDVEPETKEHKQLCNDLVNYLEKLPKRFENTI